MPNYVPAGEDNSTSKRPFGARRPNYVPAEGQEAAPSPGQELAFQEAREARARARTREKAQTWESAVKRIRNMTPSTAVETLRSLPQAVRELHLIAEEHGLGRKEVLSYFPAAGKRAREIWAEYATPVLTKSKSK